MNGRPIAREEYVMKVAVIGAGNVGKAVFHDLQHVNMVTEITLIARNKEMAKAETGSKTSMKSR